MNNKIVLEGIASGDYEAFCLDVDKDTFIKLKGKEPSEYDESCFNNGLFRIYPESLLNIQDGKKYRINIEFEELK